MIRTINISDDNYQRPITNLSPNSKFLVKSFKRYSDNSEEEAVVKVVFNNSKFLYIPGFRYHKPITVPGTQVHITVLILDIVNKCYTAP
jgi:hypothetical protein